MSPAEFRAVNNSPLSSALIDELRRATELESAVEVAQRDVDAATGPYNKVQAERALQDAQRALDTAYWRHQARQDRYCLVRVSDRRWRVAERDHYQTPTERQIALIAHEPPVHYDANSRVPFVVWRFVTEPLTEEQAAYRLMELRKTRP